jgi:hypothetical protein
MSIAMELFIYKVGIFGTADSPCQKFSVSTTAEAEETVKNLNKDGSVFLGELVQGEGVLTIDPRGYNGYNLEV